MKVIDNFLLKHFIRILLLCVAAFVGIYLLIDFFEKVDDFIEHHATITDYLIYLSNNVPFIFIQILPLAILTTMVLTIGGLSRTNEITAMRACGISLWRIVQPLMALCLTLSLLFLLLNEFVVPWNIKQLNQLLEVKLKGKQSTQLTRNEIWYRSTNKIISITVANSQEKQLQGITIFFFDKQQKIKKREDIEVATYTENKWLTPVMIERLFDKESGDLLKTSTLKNQMVAIDRTPADFFNHEDFNNELNFQQLATIAKKLDAEGYDSTRQRVDMHVRMATPFTCLIMGFLGIPFALQRGRNSNIALGIGLSLGIGVIYFIIQSLVTAFGYTSAISPLIAAWTTNFIFFLVGIWLLLSVNE